jgi:hypothetical protein
MEPSINGHPSSRSSEPNPAETTTIFPQTINSTAAHESVNPSATSGSESPDVSDMEQGERNSPAIGPAMRFIGGMGFQNNLEDDEEEVARRQAAQGGKRVKNKLAKADWLLVDQFEKLADRGIVHGMWKEIEIIVQHFPEKHQYTEKLGQEPPRLSSTSRNLWRPMTYEGRRLLSESDLLFVTRMQAAL